MSVRSDMDRIRDQQLAAFMDAFRAANPDSEVPQVSYEHGWWCFRYRATGRVPSRVRTDRFLEMTERLIARVKDQTP